MTDTKLISYKIMEHERTEDSPFMGCLICSINCKFNCKNCFNQPLKQLSTIEKTAIEIVNEIKENPFNEGIIFGGLEWTLQKDELIALSMSARNNGLQTMLYTGHDINQLEDLLDLRLFDYVKCGQYKEHLKMSNYIKYGVKLVSANQDIYKKDVDY